MSFRSLCIGWSLTLLVAAGLSGCFTLSSPAERYGLAADVAHAAGMTKRVVEANGFRLVTYQRIHALGKPPHIYIEGDGLAWKSQRWLSDDPTPTDPVALRLAVQDPADNVVYMARPCQYIPKAERRRCSSDHWSTQRFSEDVIAAADQAVDQLRERAGASGVHLIGYSGGGAVAALVAARRHDVLSLRTVAGNLDHAAFTSLHKVTPLTGSLNPASYGQALAHLPQHHFVGAEDTIMSIAVVEAFLRALPTQRCVGLTVVPHATHGDGWVENWPVLQAMIVTCGLH